MLCFNSNLDICLLTVQGYIEVDFLLDFKSLSISFPFLHFNPIGAYTAFQYNLFAV